MTTEADIQNAILRRLEQSGCLYWRCNNTPSFRKARRVASMPSGLPDIMILHAGMVVGLEVKKDGGKIREAQLLMSKRFWKEGAHYWIVASEEEAAQLLDTVGLRI